MRKAAASERTTDRGVTDLSQRMDGADDDGGGGAEGGTGVTDLVDDAAQLASEERWKRTLTYFQCEQTSGLWGFRKVCYVASRCRNPTGVTTSCALRLFCLFLHYILKY